MSLTALGRHDLMNTGTAFRWCGGLARWYEKRWPRTGLEIIDIPKKFHVFSLSFRCISTAKKNHFHRSLKHVKGRGSYIMHTATISLSSIQFALTSELYTKSKVSPALSFNIPATLFDPTILSNLSPSHFENTALTLVSPASTLPSPIVLPRNPPTISS